MDPLSLLAGAYPALIIAGIGVALYTGLGWLDKDTSYKPRKAATSAIIAFVIGVPIVSVELGLIDWSTATPEIAAIAVFGLIAQIAGIEALAKKAVGVAVKKSVK